MPRHHLRDGLAVAFSADEEVERDAEEAADAARRGRSPTYRELRAVAYRDELGKEPGDFIRTLGDVLDVLIVQVEAMRRAGDHPATQEFSELLTRIAAIKARHPSQAR